MHHLFDPKEPGTFRSSGWKRDYSPDLCSVTTNNNLEPLYADRNVVDNFPCSQYRPILNTIGMNIPNVQSIPRARWNSRKANWTKFASDIEHACIEIPARQENLETFGKLILNSAKWNIPRGKRIKYISRWSDESETCLEEYEKRPSQANADRLLNTLTNHRRKTWVKPVENLDFKHSSREAWTLL